MSKERMMSRRNFNNLAWNTAKAAVEVTAAGTLVNVLASCENPEPPQKKCIDAIGTQMVNAKQTQVATNPGENYTVAVLGLVAKNGNSILLSIYQDEEGSSIQAKYWNPRAQVAGDITYRNTASKIHVTSAEVANDPNTEAEFGGGRALTEPVGLNTDNQLTDSQIADFADQIASAKPSEELTTLAMQMELSPGVDGGTGIQEVTDPGQRRIAIDQYKPVFVSFEKALANTAA